VSYLKKRDIRMNWSSSAQGKASAVLTAKDVARW
jgi:hypothetical protein